MAERVELADYRALAEFRYQIRLFLSFSEAAARNAGIEPAQHQLLLALKGLPPDRRPNISALAERLCVKHHTAVALVDQLVKRDFVRRQPSDVDRREVMVAMTRTGEALLRRLSAQHRKQLETVGAHLVRALQTVMQGRNASAP